MIPYLLFSLNGMRYGVEALSVMEITWLPELAHAEEAPDYIAGLVNLRGKIEPVMDLGQRLGHPRRYYQPTDCIVMLQQDDVTMGMIVSEVSDVVGILPSQIEAPPRYDNDTPDSIHFQSGNAKLGDEIVMLLDVRQLIHAPAFAATVPLKSEFSAEASAREVFRTRAHNLMQSVEGQNTSEQIPLSIIKLGEERFGVGLDVVREFSHLRRVTAIPSCPPHIAGNMNLRGDILTLVDISGLLNVPVTGKAAEVMVVEYGELSIGVPVDTVLEVIYLHPGDIAHLGNSAHEAQNEYCKGVVRYGDSVLSILDMQKILVEGGLEVDEQV